MTMEYEEILFIERLRERLPNCSETEIEIEIEIAIRYFYKGWSMEEIVDYIFYG